MIIIVAIKTSWSYALGVKGTTRSCNVRPCNYKVRCAIIAISTYTHTVYAHKNLFIAYTHIYIYIYIYVYTYIWMYVYVYTYCTWVHMYIIRHRAHVHVHSCIHRGMSNTIYRYTYIQVLI